MVVGIKVGMVVGLLVVGQPVKGHPRKEDGTALSNTDTAASTHCKEVHPAKAKALILVTDGWMTTFCNDVHPSKADMPMVITVEGITMAGCSAIQL